MVETEEHISKIKWIKSERIVEDQSELKEVVIVVPAKWRFVERIEALRDEAGENETSELVYNWHFWDIPTYAGLQQFGTPTPLAPVETRTFILRVEVQG